MENRNEIEMKGDSELAIGRNIDHNMQNVSHKAKALFAGFF